MRMNSRDNKKREFKRRSRESEFGIARKKFCRFCVDKVNKIDYKDLKRLERFISERGKVVSRRISGNCAKHQRKLNRAVKLAKGISLLPFVKV